MSAIAEMRPVSIPRVDLRSAQSLHSNVEFELLLACCADVSESERTGRIASIFSGPLDWERLLLLADHHGVLPKLYERLSTLPGLVPPEQLGALHLRYQANARRCLWFTGELIRLLEHLESQGIEALPYKGPVLAQLLYGDVTGRQFGDLDVFVCPSDLTRATAALLDCGYRPALSLGEKQTQAYLRSGYECAFDGPHGRTLELQWRPLPRFYSIDFKVAGFFARAERIHLAGHTLPTLCATDLLLVLCVHAAKHVWRQLSWLCDIAHLAKSEQVDWQAVRAVARQLGIERIMAVNFFLAHRLLGSAAPASIQDWLKKDRVARSVADEVVLPIERGAHHNFESISYFRSIMRLRERRQDRMRLLWRLAFTPGVGEWSAVRLPKVLFPLYRAVRLFRLGKRLALTH
jgi:hypothetical protein